MKEAKALVWMKEYWGRTDWRNPPPPLLQANWLRQRLGKAIKIKRKLGKSKGIGTPTVHLTLPRAIKCKAQQDFVAVQEGPPTKHFRFSDLPTEIKELVFFAMLPTKESSTEACSDATSSDDVYCYDYRDSRFKHIGHHQSHQELQGILPLEELTHQSLKAMTSTCRE